MLDKQKCLQNNIRNAKATKFLLQLAFYTSKGRGYCILREMRNNYARKFYVQYLRKLGLSFVNAQYMRKIFSPIYAQNLCKIVFISPMRKICARLFLFLQCAIYAQDYISFLNVQDVCKTVLFSSI